MSWQLKITSNKKQLALGVQEHEIHACSIKLLSTYTTIQRLYLKTFYNISISIIFGTTARFLLFTFG